MTKKHRFSRGIEIAFYALLFAVAISMAIIPHILDFGWAWDWPFAGSGFVVSFLGCGVVFLIAGVALAFALVRSRESVRLFRLRLATVLVLIVGPFIVFNSFGGLGASQGWGLVHRFDRVTSLDTLQAWAVQAISSPKGESKLDLPPEVSGTLPPGAKVSLSDDHVVVRWYNVFILVGPPEFEVDDNSASFFLERVRPGVYVNIESY